MHMYVGDGEKGNLKVERVAGMARCGVGHTHRTEYSNESFTLLEVLKSFKPGEVA